MCFANESGLLETWAALREEESVQLRGRREVSQGWRAGAGTAGERGPREEWVEEEERSTVCSARDLHLAGGGGVSTGKFFFFGLGWIDDRWF